MLSKDPFDIAPHARPNAGGAWMALVVGALFAVGGAALLADSARRWNDESRVARELQATVDRQRANEVASRNAGPDRASLERIKAQQELNRMLGVSWSSLFDALESAGHAVKGRASVVSIGPVSAKADFVQVEIGALAMSTTAMIEYIRALERSPRVEEVRLSMQQPATNAGAPVVRFQLSLLWDAREGVSLPIPSRATLGAPKAAAQK